MVQEDDEGLPAVELVIAAIEDTSFVAGLDVRVTALPECDYVRHEDCAQTSAAAQVRVGAGAEEITLRPGAEPREVELRNRRVQFAVPLAQVRALVDTACAAGPDRAGVDAVVVAVTRWGGT
jgi:hypothetical protein